MVKKTPLAAYSNPRTSGVIAINLDEDDDLIGVAETAGNHHILLGTRRGVPGGVAGTPSIQSGAPVNFRASRTPAAGPG